MPPVGCFLPSKDDERKCQVLAFSQRCLMYGKWLVGLLVGVTELRNYLCHHLDDITSNQLRNNFKTPNSPTVSETSAV